MPLLRPLTWLVSLAVHAALLLAIVGVSSGGASFDTGTGNDMFVVEQGIAVEGVAKFGEAEEMIETVDIPPVQPVERRRRSRRSSPSSTTSSPRPKPSTRSRSIKEDPKPIEDKPVAAVPVQEQAPQVATLIEQSSGQRKQGGDTTQRRRLPRHAVEVDRAQQGQSALAPSRHGHDPLHGQSDGEPVSRAVEKSSGSKLLDEAAIAALDRAAPFPPMPPGRRKGPMEVQRPFQVRHALNCRPRTSVVSRRTCRSGTRLNDF